LKIKNIDLSSPVKSQGISDRILKSEDLELRNQKDLNIDHIQSQGDISLTSTQGSIIPD
jgi:hypothetical protein